MRFNRRRFMQGSALAGGTALAACATANVGAAHVDPMFSQPFIDVDEWRDTPTRHRYVHGGFTGTDARFVFYFPPAERYQGRFFQYISPVPVPEDRVYSEFGNNDPLGFGFASGAYVVGSNQGGAGATGVPGSGVDPTLAAFRASAASAEYSRVVAREMYGGRRPYGYGLWRQRRCFPHYRLRPRTPMRGMARCPSSWAARWRSRTSTPCAATRCAF